MQDSASPIGQLKISFGPTVLPQVEDTQSGSNTTLLKVAETRRRSRFWSSKTEKQEPSGDNCDTMNRDSSRTCASPNQGSPATPNTQAPFQKHTTIHQKSSLHFLPSAATGPARVRLPHKASESLCRDEGKIALRDYSARLLCTGQYRGSLMNLGLHTGSNPVIVPVLETKSSISKPSCCSMETNRFVRG